jgi:hypothetical protein
MKNRKFIPKTGRFPGVKPGFETEIENQIVRNRSSFGFGLENRTQLRFRKPVFFGWFWGFYISVSSFVQLIKYVLPSIEWSMSHKHLFKPFLSGCLNRFT